MAMRTAMNSSHTTKRATSTTIPATSPEESVEKALRIREVIVPCGSLSAGAAAHVVVATQGRPRSPPTEGGSPASPALAAQGRPRSPPTGTGSPGPSSVGARFGPPSQAGRAARNAAFRSRTVWKRADGSKAQARWSTGRSAEGTSGPANPAAATDGDGSRSASR